MINPTSGLSYFLHLIQIYLIALSFIFLYNEPGALVYPAGCVKNLHFSHSPDNHDSRFPAVC